MRHSERFYSWRLHEGIYWARFEWWTSLKPKSDWVKNGRLCKFPSISFRGRHWYWRVCVCFWKVNSPSAKLRQHICIELRNHRRNVRSTPPVCRILDFYKNIYVSARFMIQDMLLFRVYRSCSMFALLTGDRNRAYISWGPTYAQKRWVCKEMMILTL